MHNIEIKRAYLPADSADGFRILVDRLWPRGRSKIVLKLDLWEKAIAPSNEVRDAFCHIPERFPAFRGAYRKELAQNPIAADFLNLVKDQLQTKTVTLVYGAKEERFNQAVVLREWLKEKLGIPG